MQRVLVTAGANGIGLAIARAFHASGARVYVCDIDAAALERHKKDIEAAGYRIVEVLAYAPQAAWVHAASGDAGESLSHVAKLEAIAGIEEVEPQMLRPRALK